MIALTSISPKHTNGNNQAEAVKSWKEHGFKVVSLNHPSEIEALKPLYPEVDFIPTERTAEKHFGKKYVMINALLDYAKQAKGDHFLIINSDILLFDKHNVLPGIKQRSEEGITFIKRMDYETDFATSKKYDHGIDAFFIHRKFLDIFPQSIYCMGQTFWDYWIPYRSVEAGVPIFELKEPLAYHKKHDIQYKPEEWVKMGRYFQWENNLERFNNGRSGIARMSHYVYNKFTQAAK